MCFCASEKAMCFFIPTHFAVTLWHWKYGNSIRFIVRFSNERCELEILEGPSWEWVHSILEDNPNDEHK